MMDDFNSTSVLKHPSILDALGVSNKKRISEELFIKLRDAILSGDLPEGYVFPNESVLCGQLGVGRSTLREAFASLDTLNLITRAKTGTFVNKDRDIKNAMNFDMIMQNTDPENVMEFRGILEIGMAGSAAKKVTDTDIKTFEAIISSMEQNSDDPKILTVCDYDFHSHIVKIANNELLYIAFNSVRAYYEKYVLEAFQNQIFSTSISDHKEIVEAFKKHDSEQARAAMRKHLKHIEKFVKMKAEQKR